MKTESVTANTSNGWQKVTLGELLEFKNGINAEKASYGSGVPFVNVMEIIRHDVLDVEKIPGRISIDKKTLEKNLVVRGDVLFNRTSETPEEIGLTSVYLDSKAAVFGGFVIRGRSRNQLISEGFKKYCFSSKQVRHQIIERGQGVLRMNIGQKDLEKVVLSFPGIAQQDKIVEVLDTWDQVIGKLKRKIEMKKEINFGLSQKLLTGKTRLSGFSKPWTQVKISSFSKPISKLNTDNSCTEVLSCTKYDGLVRSLEYFGRKVYGNNLTKYKVVPKGYFAYATNHIEEGSIGYQDIIDAGLVSPMYTVFKTEGVNNHFLYKLLKTPKLISEYRRHMSASVERRGGLRWPSFSSIKVSLPSVEEQNAISELIQTSENEIRSLERKLKYIAEQKTYLLNNLITGTIRTPETLSVNA